MTSLHKAVGKGTQAESPTAPALWDNDDDDDDGDGGDGDDEAAISEVLCLWLFLNAWMLHPDALLLGCWGRGFIVLSYVARQVPRATVHRERVLHLSSRKLAAVIRLLPHPV